MYNTVCSPKERVRGERVTLPARFCDGGQKTVFAAFDHYARQKGLTFEEGVGGITLIKKEMDEAAVQITIDKRGVSVYASGAAGFHHGLAILAGEITAVENGFSLDSGRIAETYDMPYRGLMVDLARQWHGPEYILQYIDLCYLNRATHLQLHFADNESFTLPLDCFPRLSTEGRTYKKEDIAHINAYAKERGIILVPEVDIPGHTAPFCEKYPDIFGRLITETTEEGFAATFNILPADEAVFDALRQIFAEVAAMFPDSPLIHIGGDEAAVNKWAYCPKTQAYMKQHGITDLLEMYAEYIRIVTTMVLDMGRTPVVWEGFAKEYNDRISREVIVIAWESYYQPAYDLAAAGFKIINCSWKPLYIVTPATYWTPAEILAWNPWNWQHFWEKSVAYPDGYTIDKDAQVLGGQICAWGDCLREYDDWEKGAKEELALIAERLPALCKRLSSLTN